MSYLEDGELTDDDFLGVKLPPNPLKKERKRQDSDRIPSPNKKGTYSFISDFVILPF